ncbi:unnamed protein product, partial [Sphacelaria rigidula]
EIVNDQSSRATSGHNIPSTTFSGEKSDPPADHPPPYFAVSLADPDQFTLPEHCPDLVGGKVSVDPTNFTTRVAIHSGPNATTPTKCVSLLDS